MMTLHIKKAPLSMLLACLFLSLFVLGNPLVTYAAGISGGETNLISNPGFELGEAAGLPLNWSRRGGENDWVILTDNEVVSGNWAVGLHTPSDRTSGWGIQSEKIPVEAGATYEATGMIKLFGARVQIYIEFYPETGPRITPYVGQINSNDEWTLLTVSGEAPEGSDYARVLLYMPPNVPGTYAFFDNITFAKWRSPDDEQFEEYIYNGDFELSDANGFPDGNHRKIGSGSVQVDYAFSNSGVSSLYVGEANGGPVGFGINTAMTAPLLAGNTYQVTVRYRAPDVISNGVAEAPFYLRLGTRSVGAWDREWVSIDHFDHTVIFGATLIYVRPIISPSLDPNAWHRLTVTVKIPDESGLIINLYNESTDYPVWFDDISLRRVDDDEFRDGGQPGEQDANREPTTFYLSPTGDNHNPGTAAEPWATIPYATQRAIPGDTIVFLPGDYPAVLQPVRSGTPGAPIVFKSSERRQARLMGNSSGTSHAVNLSGIKFVDIEGFHIKPQSVQGRWLLIDNSQHITVEDVLMEDATGGMPMHITNSTQVRVRDSVIRKYSGSSHNMARVGDSSHILFEGNSVSRAGHSPFQFYPDSSVRFVVIRGNVFHAAWGRNFEFFGTRDIVFENNIITNALDSGRSASANAKFATERGIFRFNRVFRNWGGAIHLYPFRDVWLNGIRLYNNVFDGNNEYGIAISGSESRDVFFLNNVFSRNDVHRSDRQVRIGSMGHPETGAGGEVIPRVNFMNNVFAADDLDNESTIDYRGLSFSIDVVESGAWRTRDPTNQTVWFDGNMGESPEFIDAVNFDHGLNSGSGLLNSGRFLTSAVGSGEGRTLIVEDAAYFYSGYCIRGEKGDVIAIGSPDQTATIVHIDYHLNEIMLDRTVQWNDGDPVSFPWGGSRPDIGVYEYGVGARPSVNVSATPFLVRPNEDVHMSVTLNGIDDPAEIRWQLGDGTMAFGSVLTHRYPEPYDYPIRVRVTTESGEIYRGTGYVVVETERPIDEPLHHSTFDADDEDWWKHWKYYRPTPVDTAREIDEITGDGLLRIANPGDGEMPLKIAPAQWDIDRYPWVYLRYRLSPGAAVAWYINAFSGTDGVGNKKLLAVPSAHRWGARITPYELIDDGEWHTLLMDARLIRDHFPEVDVLQRFGMESLPTSTAGDTLWLDEVAILPSEAWGHPDWEGKLPDVPPSPPEPPAGPVEMIFNGDFEIVGEGGFPEGEHRLIGEAIVYVDDAVARSGDHSLYIGKGRGSASDGLGVNTSMTGPIVAGKTYELSMWYRAPDMIADGKIPLFLRVLANGLPTHINGFQSEWIHPIDPDAGYTATTVAGNAHLYIRTSPVTGMDPDGWHPISVHVTIPVDLTRFTINLYNESKDYPVWIDDLSLKSND